MTLHDLARWTDTAARYGLPVLVLALFVLVLLTERRK